MPNLPPISARDLESAFAGRFEVRGEIGTGGQGAVYRAIRRATPDGAAAADDVALKIYNGRTEVVRVAREVDALTRIRHASIANLVEHGSVVVRSETSLYVACDFIEGTPLDKRLVGGRLPPNVVAAIARDILRAISELWSRRIVHRDVNPKNIMLRVGERDSVLIDLGIARHIGQGPITSLGTAWGTNGYMSPEQDRAEQQLSCFSDVFSLGVVLQESLLGAHPTGCDQDALDTSPPKTAGLIADAPPAIAALIDQMLSPRPAFRPQPETLAESFAALASTLAP